MFSPLTKQLIEALRGLPGVGPKSAQRMAFNLLAETGREKAAELSTALKQAVEHVGQCHSCRMYTEQNLCEICANPKRNNALLCIVESPADVIAIEQTHSFKGHYYVLQGHLSPLDGIGPQEIGIPQLLKKIAENDISEIIIATNPTMEGKATSHYIINHVDQEKIKCSRIAHGVPLGGELEYLDSGTLAHAFYSRVEMTDEQL